MSKSVAHIDSSTKGATASHLLRWSHFDELQKIDDELERSFYEQQAIEQTLDRLLDVACCDAGLKLFRRLCRYYWTINPEATAGYINAYREMWDTEDGEVAEADLGDAPQSSRHFPNAVRQIRMSTHPNGYGTWNVPATLEVAL